MSTATKSPKGRKTEVSEIYSNTCQEIIEVTTDKLKIILMQHLSKIEQNGDWRTPLGILITIAITFASASFKPAFGLSADTWLAIFLLSGVILIIVLIRALFKITKQDSIDTLIQKIKNCDD